MPAVKEGFVQEIIERYDGDPGMLIPMMQDLQAEYGYLPPDELKRLSKELGVPLTRVYGVAMFYASFRLVPKGRHEVTLCMGTVCHLKGAPRISEAICTEYAIQPGGTTADRLFTLQAVNCVGACALAPVMIVDGKYYAGVNPDAALKVLRELASQAEGAEAAEAAPEGQAAESAAGPAPAAKGEGPTAGPAPATVPEAPAAAPATAAEAPAVPATLEAKAARATAKSSAKPKARPKAGSKGTDKAKAKAGPVRAAKPAAAARIEKPVRAVKKDKPGAGPKGDSKGTKKGGRK